MVLLNKTKIALDSISGFHENSFELTIATIFFTFMTLW